MIPYISTEFGHTYSIDIDKIIEYCFPNLNKGGKDKETTEIYDFLQVDSDGEESYSIPRISQKVVRQTDYANGGQQEDAYQYDLIKLFLNVLLNPMDETEGYNDKFPFAISFNTFLEKGFIKEINNE